MINLRFLGTGGLGKARLKNKLSKDYRRFATLLVDENLIINPTEDTFEFEESFMLSGMLRGVRDVFITDSGLEHFSVLALERLASYGKIRVFAGEGLRDEISAISNVEFTALSPFSLVECDRKRVMALPSNFKTDNLLEESFNFLIDCGEKNIFYGLDGAWINASAWKVLREIKLDAVILDCAAGLDGYSEACVNHNNLKMASDIRDIMLSAGVCEENTKFILSHIPTDKKRSIHEEMCMAVEETPFRIAYDGYFLGI